MKHAPESPQSRAETLASTEDGEQDALLSVGAIVTPHLQWQFPFVRAGALLFLGISCSLCAAFALVGQPHGTRIGTGMAALQGKSDQGYTEAVIGGGAVPRVYVYDLPPIFNTLLYKCRFGLTEGYGEDVGEFHGMRLAKTSQFMLEAVFHQRLLEREDLLVSNPADADIFYVPYYAQMAYLCLRTSPVPDDAPEELLPYFGEDAAFLDAALFEELRKEPWLGRRGGIDHSLVIGAIGRECAFSPSLPAGSGVFLAAEVEVREFTIGTLEAWTQPSVAHIVTVPYPSSLHCVSPSQCGVGHDATGAYKRSRLALFIGDLDRSPYREDLIPSLAGYPDDAAAVSTDSVGGGFYGNLDYFLGMMADSTFCLEPPGDSPTRKGFFDALLAGCIPVIFGSSIWDSAPFEEDLPVAYENYTVWLPDPGQAVPALKAISSERVAELQANGRRVAWALSYPVPGAAGHGDAVELFLREAARRSRGPPTASS